MSLATHDVDLAVLMAEARRPSVIPTGDEKVPVADEKAPANEKATSLSASDSDNRIAPETLPKGQEKFLGIFRRGEHADTENAPEPTFEELATLRRVSGKIPWIAYTVAFVELCERFSYYGSTAVFVNFIQQPRPEGSRTGAAALATNFNDETVSGALGYGQRASTGLTTFNSFWAYVMPLFGGWVADTYLGRFATIQYSIAFALVGHVILIISSIPSVIDHPNSAIGAFAVGLIIMGIGTGGFKSNIAPLIAEQVTQRRMKVVSLRSGERVIVDPTVTISRVFLYFYMMVNVGSLIGQIGMVFAEKYVGFWLSYTLPTAMFLLCPLVLFACYNKYTKQPPTGSILGKAFKLWKLSLKGRISINPAKTAKNLQDPEYWNAVKPSRLGANKPAWMTFDDAWVEQVARGLNACKIFLWYPLYWLAYNQMVNNLTSQSATLELHGVPNDVVNNLNPLSLVIMIPIFDQFIYPALRKAKIRFTPLKRIATGFWLASMAMVSATVLQYYIYKKSPCGRYPSDCDSKPPINVWVQTIPYVLIGFSEIMASITGLEYAFTKAPENMRSLVQGVFLLQSAFSSALGQALVPLATDPLLEWNYGVSAVLAAIGGLGFWYTHRGLDKQEDQLNMIAETEYLGRAGTASRRASIAAHNQDPETGKL